MWVASLKGLVSALIKKKREGRLWKTSELIPTWTAYSGSTTHLADHSQHKCVTDVWSDNKVLTWQNFFKKFFYTRLILCAYTDTVSQFVTCIPKTGLTVLSNQNLRHSLLFRLGPLNWKCKNYSEIMCLLCRYKGSPLAANPVLLLVCSSMDLGRWIKLDLCIVSHGHTKSDLH